MPKAYPIYPYIEPLATGLTDDEIEREVADMVSQNPQLARDDGGPLDALCRALNVDVEYSASPNDVLLDVPLKGRAVVWLPRNGKPRHDRLTLATGIGHWILHVPATRTANPKCGIQALYRPTDPKALREARIFAFDLLMPAKVFTSLWYQGRAQLVAETLNVPTQAVYDRAKWLDLTSPEDEIRARKAAEKAAQALAEAEAAEKAQAKAEAAMAQLAPHNTYTGGSYARRIGK